MIMRYDVKRDDTSLSTVSNKLLILDVKHGQQRISRKTNKVAERYGSRIYGNDVEAASITISMQLREYSIHLRQVMCENIIKWANSGNYIKTNDRTGQQLRCELDSPPTIQSVRNWLDPVEMTFVAYNPPFWQETTDQTVTLTGTSGSSSIVVEGNVKRVPLRQIVITANANATSVNMTVNGQTFKLSNLAMTANQAVAITYDDSMIMHIKKGNISLLDRRTADSCDELTVDCGKSNSFSFTSDGSVTIDFKIRGWWV